MCGPRASTCTLAFRRIREGMVPERDVERTLERLRRRALLSRRRCPPNTHTVPTAVAPLFEFRRMTM